MVLFRRFDELLAFLLDAEVAFVGITESRTYGQDLSGEDYLWLRGPEVLPTLNNVLPPWGIGALVSRKLFPSADVVRSTVFTLWVCLIVLVWNFVVFVRIIAFQFLMKRRTFLAATQGCRI